MQFDWWTFAFQVINILVLLWLLNRFLFRPVARIIAERKTETDKVLVAAEAAKRAAEEAEKAARTELDRISAERVSLLEAARAEAETQREVLLAKVKQEAAYMVERAKTEVAHLNEEDRRQRVQHVAELAVTISGRLLADLPGDCRISGYPQRLADALAALDDEQKAALGAEAGKLRLVAPRALSEAELKAVQEAIGSLVPLDGTLSVDVDPSLIAGLELRSHHGVIHNSLGSDLARIAEALSKDEQS